METWVLAIKIVVTAFVAFEISIGESWGRFRYSNNSWHAIPQRISHHETPDFFWINVAFQTVLVLILWLR